MLTPDMVSDRWSNKQEICDIYNAPVEIKDSDFFGFLQGDSTGKYLSNPITSVLEWAKFLNYCKGYVCKKEINTFKDIYSYIGIKHTIMYSSVVLLWSDINWRYISPILFEGDKPLATWKFAWSMLYKFNFFKESDLSLSDKKHWLLNHSLDVDALTSTQIFNMLTGK